MSIIWLALFVVCSAICISECESYKRELKEVFNRGNSTFNCTRSGSCVPCSFSEKGDEQYHCSETGYHMLYKCMEIKSDLKEVKKVGDVSHDNSGIGSHRGLAGDADASSNDKQVHNFYKSCVPDVDDEKMSVLGFEAIVMCLLIICSPIVYYRKKRSFIVSGGTRIQMSSRF